MKEKGEERERKKRGEGGRERERTMEEREKLSLCTAFNPKGKDETQHEVD